MENLNEPGRRSPHPAIEETMGLFGMAPTRVRAAPLRKSSWSLELALSGAGAVC
jgi:hypothetical protein